MSHHNDSQIHNYKFMTRAELSTLTCIFQLTRPLTTMTTPIFRIKFCSDKKVSFFLCRDFLATINVQSTQVRRAGEAKRAFSPRLEIGIKNQIYLEKNWSRHLHSDYLIWFLQWQFFCRYETHTAQSQVHCYNVMRWWACSSLMTPLPAEASCESRERIVLLLVFIA